MRNAKLNLLCLLALSSAGATACDAAESGELRPAGRRSRERPERDAASGSGLGGEGARLVGEVEGSDIRLAMVLDAGARGRVFFCGGPSSYATATRWLGVQLDDGGTLELDEDGWRVSARLERGALAGELRLPDQPAREFRAFGVREGSLEGLYEGRSDCGRIGLIVVQPEASGEPLGQGACVGADHAPEQVNPILPIALQGDEIEVRVGAGDAAVTSGVRLAAPIAE